MDCEGNKLISPAHDYPPLTDNEGVVGTGARNLEPRLPVVDQTGEYKKVSGTYAKT